jgi:hypothetical protein
MGTSEDQYEKKTFYPSIDPTKINSVNPYQPISNPFSRNSQLKSEIKGSNE